MRGDYVMAIEGLTELHDLESLNPAIVKAATMAINRTLDRSRTLSAREMRTQVRFPSRYLEGENARLKITQRATSDRFEGIISGRRNPTSLARFVTGSAKGRVTLEVKPGHLVTLGRAFITNLKSGTGELGNVGLAVRTRIGEKPSNAYKPVRLKDGLWLLYGPSVDQVFQTVRDDIKPETEEFLANEFSRLLELGL